MKFTVSASWHNFHLCPSSQQILMTSLTMSVYRWWRHEVSRYSAIAVFLWRYNIFLLHSLMKSITTKRDRVGYKPQENATTTLESIMTDDRLLKKLTLEMVRGHRRPGQPPRRWIDDFLMWCYKETKKHSDYGRGKRQWEKIGR